jgi:hypothetical protein
MGLTDASTLVAAFALLAALTVATLMSWGRLDSLTRWRWPIRVSMLVSCQVLAVGAAGLSLNRTYDFYVSWSELLGQHATSHSRKISANLNDVVWRAQHLPSPNLDILLFATMQEPASVRDVRRFEQAARPPLQLWDVILPRGGHNRYTWISEMPTAFGWMSRYLASPLLPVPSVDGLLPVSSSPRTVGPVSSSPKRIVHANSSNARSPVRA